MPGYLPEMTPIEVNSLSDACDILMDECDRMAMDNDDYDDCRVWAEINTELAKLAHSERSIDDYAIAGPDGYVYCINSIRDSH